MPYGIYKRTSEMKTGKHIRTKEQRKKQSEVQRGKHNSPKTEFKKGHKTPKEVREKIRKTLIGQNLGDKNPAWKGGITPLNERIRHSYKNRQWISDVFTRDNYICQKCGYDGGRILEAHHIKLFSFIMDKYKIRTYKDAMSCNELWNINNGITLCKKCHILVHKIPGWSDKDLAKLKENEK